MARNAHLDKGSEFALAIAQKIFNLCNVLVVVCNVGVLSRIAANATYL